MGSAFAAKYGTGIPSVRGYDFIWGDKDHVGSASAVMRDFVVGRWTVEVFLYQDKLFLSLFWADHLVYLPKSLNQSLFVLTLDIEFVTGQARDEDLFNVLWDLWALLLW